MSDSPPPGLTVELEACTLEDLGVDEQGNIPELLAWCAAVIDTIALESDRTRLVITADFVQSVRDRTESDYYRENYDVERGTGTVGGKTMTLPDGSIAVLLPASGFVAADAEEDPEERETTIKRTAVHEAHHVAMEQAGEGSPAYSSDPWAWQNLLAAADAVISEYRAELGVAEFGGFGYQGWDYLEMLEDFRSRIRAMDREYQESLDVGALAISVGTQAVMTWRLFGYLAAFLRDPDVGFHPLPPEWSQSAIWRDVVGDQWGPFTAGLAAIPSGAQRMDRDNLDAHIEALASVLQSWLRSMGFYLHDTTDGPNFEIVSRHLLD